MPASFWAAYLARLAVVALLLAALYVAARRLKQMGFAARRGRVLHVVETIALAPNAALHVVRIGPRRFLIGSGAVAGIGELAPAPQESGTGEDEATKR